MSWLEKERLAVLVCVRLWPRAVAIRAVNWPVAPRLEGYLGILAALSAHRREHLSLAAAVALDPVSLAGFPAGCASARRIGKALLCEELLLRDGEYERRAAISAR